MHGNYWTESAATLQVELEAVGIEPNAAVDVIAANAGEWFSAMSVNVRASVIATMRNMASV